MTRRSYRGPILVATLVVAGVLAAAALATSGDFHDGGANSNAAFCATTNGDCNNKTRNDSATWLSGYKGYVGLFDVTLNGGIGGWDALQDNTSGSGYNSTWSNVEAKCGNDSSVTYTETCYTSNL
jgi:hypothetical protein